MIRFYYVVFFIIIVCMSCTGAADKDFKKLCFKSEDEIKKYILENVLSFDKKAVDKFIRKNKIPERTFNITYPFAYYYSARRNYYYITKPICEPLVKNECWIIEIYLNSKKNNLSISRGGIDYSYP